MYFQLTIVSVLVKGLDGKKIVDVGCGQQHSVAIDSDG
jgi:alpha-tubulin suppressor-like RCC1 family protein